MSRHLETDTIIYPRVLLVAVQSPYNLTKDIASYFEEFINLVKSNGVHYDHIEYVKLRSIDPGHYFTKGKLEELIEIVKKENIEEIVISEPLSPQQERNLGELFRRPVYDRTQIILEIFEKGAVSAEGKTQVALAMIQHAKSRLAGRGIHMSQQGGRIGTRGPGETQKEKDTQHLEHLMVKLRRDLERLAKTRETQRKQRLTTKIPLVCLIGYTNAGKSSILNALTKSSVLAEDKLFATLDTTTRELYLHSKKIGLISDTVGFIQQLPHQLIEAFKSTLSELQHAHLLLHVVDISNSNWESHINVVKNVLQELDVVDKPMVYVFNKVDRLTESQIPHGALERYQPHVLTSTITEDGLATLISFLEAWHAHQPQVNNKI